MQTTPYESEIAFIKFDCIDKKSNVRKLITHVLSISNGIVKHSVVIIWIGTSQLLCSLRGQIFYSFISLSKEKKERFFFANNIY